MKVAYFSNQFAQKSGHGVARYAKELYHSLNQLKDAPSIMPIAAWSDWDKVGLVELKKQTGLQLMPWGRRVTPFVWSFFYYPKLESWLPTIDIVHAVSLGYVVATKKPFVVTVHDIGPLTHPEFFTNKPSWIMQKSLQQAVKQAASIICVSEATASELDYYVKKKYKYSIADRITVIYEGVSDFFITPSVSNVEMKLDINHIPYILSVGKISPRKNVISILKALARLGDEVPHHLITVGGDGWDAQEVNKITKALNLEHRVHFLGYVSDEHLKQLYKKATVFVYPSLFEGFGLTILEAMASGCPVITSNTSSLPEVAGNAAILINPTDIKSLEETLLEVCTNSTIRDKLIKKGLEHSRKFEWMTTAEKVNQIYKIVL